MVKIRSGLLATLVLLSVVLIGALLSQEARAGVGRSRPAFYADSRTQGGPANEGEPDAGQTTRPPTPYPTVRPYRSSGGSRQVAVGYARLVRWTTRIWMARYLGIGF
jgi:hypothetical protein